MLVIRENNAAFNLHPTRPGPEKLKSVVILLFGSCRGKGSHEQRSRGFWGEGATATAVPGIWGLASHMCRIRSSHSQVVEFRKKKCFFFFSLKKSLILSALIKKNEVPRAQPRP